MSNEHDLELNADPFAGVDTEDNAELSADEEDGLDEDLPSIEKGIPLPPPRTTHRYGFDRLEVGDSIYVEGNNKSIASSVQQAAKRLDRKFTSRKENNGYRIWRVS